MLAGVRLRPHVLSFDSTWLLEAHLGLKRPSWQHEQSHNTDWHVQSDRRAKVSRSNDAFVCKLTQLSDAPALAILHPSSSLHVYECSLVSWLYAIA